MVNYTGTDNLEIMAEAKNYNNYLIKLIEKNIPKNSKVLDFGAGIGTFASILQKKGYEVICIEPDKKQLKKIKEKSILSFQKLDQIEDNSLEFIYSLNVLEHIEDHLDTLKELRSKLKPGGIILLYLPAFNLLYSSMDKKVGHFKRYDKKIVKKLALDTPVNIEKIYYVDSLGFFATLLYKYKGDKNGDINKKALIIYDGVVFPLSRIFDFIFRRFFGKNIFFILKK